MGGAAIVLAPQERISADSAIRAVTSEAARQLFSDHEIGILEPGKFVHFVILDQDPRSIDPDSLKVIKVVETWMDERQFYKI